MLFVVRVCVVCCSLIVRVCWRWLLPFFPFFCLSSSLSVFHCCWLFFSLIICVVVRWLVVVLFVVLCCCCSYCVVVVVFLLCVVVVGSLWWFVVFACCLCSVFSMIWLSSINVVAWCCLVCGCWFLLTFGVGCFLVLI